ncbi:MAG: hypothetical protein ACRDL0_07765 [Thermoleophilaceae bacterium]
MGLLDCARKLLLAHRRIVVHDGGDEVTGAVRENERARPFLWIVREADLFSASERDNRQVEVEQRAVALDLVLLTIDGEPN